MKSEPETAASAVVHRYLGALNRHDLEAAGKLLAEDATLTFVGAGFEMTKPQILTALGWDVGAKGHFTYDIVESGEREVVIQTRETNDFLDLLELPAIEGNMRFTVDARPLITAITYEVTGGAMAEPGAVERALEPAVAWAREHRPEEIAALYPDEQISYTRESAERWVALLREWRASGVE